MKYWGKKKTTKQNIELISMRDNVVLCQGVIHERKLLTVCVVTLSDIYHNKAVHTLAARS